MIAKFKMKENKDFLKYIYHEDVYLIDEPVISEDAGKTAPNAEKEPEVVKVDLPIVQEVKPVTFLGNNEKGILILVHDLNTEFLNQKELEFLMAIVNGGLKLTKVDIAIVNLANFPIIQVLDEIQYNYLISFDENEKSNSKYQVMDKEGKKILYAENLTAIEADKEKKRSLWNALISMFNINI